MQKLHTRIFSSIVGGNVHPPPAQASAATKNFALMSSSMTSSLFVLFLDIRSYLEACYTSHEMTINVGIYITDLCFRISSIHLQSASLNCTFLCDADELNY